MLRRLFRAPVAGTVVMLLALAGGVVAGAATAIPSPYYIITPGGAYDLSTRVHVPSEHQREAGHLSFTAVYARPGAWLDVAIARRSRGSEVVPAEEIRPPGMSQEQVNEANKAQIDESKPIAAAVGLRAAGYDVRISGQGALVENVSAGLPAEGVLQKGDIVVAVDGQETLIAPQLVELIRRHQVGDRVRLTVIRGGQRQDLVVGTKSSPTEPGVPVVGVSIRTNQFDVQLPFPVEIDSDNVGGPSAGLMFSLAVLDAVTDGDLARGHHVAGTGTIGIDGSVGPIGGAAGKVVAAEQAGDDTFLVPREDYADAQKGARTIRLIPVDRFADAVRALCSLDPTAPGAPIPPPCTEGIKGGLA